MKVTLMSDSRGPGTRVRVIVVAPLMSMWPDASGQKTFESRVEVDPPHDIVPMMPSPPLFALGVGYIPVVPSGHSNLEPVKKRNILILSTNDWLSLSNTTDQTILHFRNKYETGITWKRNYYEYEQKCL